MKKLLILVIALLLLFIFRVNLLSAYAGLFRVNTATKNADVMVILSGNIDTRPTYAAKLYHEGYAKRVFLTQEIVPDRPYSDYIEARNRYAEKFLKELGVPIEWLPSKTKQGATSTFDEAYDLVYFLKNNRAIKRVILVTDTPHTYRSFYAFSKILSANDLDSVKIQMAAAPNDVFDETNWFMTEKGLIYYFEETVKLMFYWVSLGNATWLVPN